MMNSHFLQSYDAFLPDTSQNKSGFFGPDEWVADTWKAQQAAP